MKLPFMFRLKGTVIQAIYQQVIFVMLYTSGLVYIHNYVDGWKIDFPHTLIPVLGVVTGLLLVFRTNTAYDRYWEGRKLWSTMTLDIRTLARCIWVMVEERTSKDIIEKISAINLLVAFAYATRNYLREEYSYDEEDLRELISHIPKFQTPSSTTNLIDQEKCIGDPKNHSKIGRDSDIYQIPSSYTPKESSSRKRWGSKIYNVKAYEAPVPTNIPIEISYYIASYVYSAKEKEIIDGPTFIALNAATNSLVNCLGGFERILRTPIPLAYSVHLHHATWLYILALPFQIIGALNWYSIPAVSLAAFSLLGILGIGWEIENPFGYDENDLPLDDFCKVIHKEILRIISHPIPSPESWILSEENHPLFPESKYTATDLSKMSEEDVRNILARGSNLQFSTRNLNRQQPESETELNSEA